MISAVLLVFGASLFQMCEGYGAGAPAGACGHMRPGHTTQSDPIAPQGGTSPFGIYVSKSTYGPEEKLQVTLNGTNAFLGFFIQARPSGEDEPVGAFSGLQAIKMQTVECSSDYQSAAITHANQHETETPWNSSFTVTWTAPKESKGNITFFATVVQEYDTFWVKVPSESIEYNGFAVLTPVVSLFLLPIALALVRLM